jgi:UDP-galactopyranose mutase
VFYVEEPVFGAGPVALEICPRECGLHVVRPHLPRGITEERSWLEQRRLVDQLLVEQDIQKFTAWYYTPMALPFTQHLQPEAIVYDCMDELSLFKGAHPRLLTLESELFRLADLVFTGGQSLFEAKKDRHGNIHPFPSSIDGAHFRKARTINGEPADQRTIPGPRLGFFGVLDERFDTDLVRGVAERRPDWNIVLIGPVVKINPATLPRLPNIHYLGKKDYQELPHYLAGWDLAFLPFARNDSTKYISPTKTPEYLAAGRPVVSTSIRDVVRPYAHEKLVRIADTPGEFVAAAEAAIQEACLDPHWLARVDAFLAQTSWDSTVSRMSLLETHARAARIKARSLIAGATQGEIRTQLGA